MKKDNSKSIEDKRKSSEEKRALKGFVPVSKATTADTGIVSVFSKGFFRLVHDRWALMVKCSSTDTLAKVFEELPCRLRLTTVCKDGEVSFYITLIADTPMFVDAKELFARALNLLKDSGVTFTALSIDDTFSVIMGLYGKNGTFGFAHANRQKKSLSASYAVPITEETDNYSTINLSGSVYCMNNCNLTFTSPISMFYSFGFDFTVAFDVTPLDDDMYRNYRKMLESHYLCQIPSAKEKSVSTSLIIATQCGSDEERKTVEEILLKTFPDNGITLSPMYGRQKKGVQSVFTLGIIDAQFARMIAVSDAGKFVF